MSKKTILIIAILIVIAIAGFIIFSSKENQAPTDVPNNFSWKNFFPFGDPGSSQTGDSSTSLDDDVNAVLPPISSTSQIPKLRKISIDPVAGAVVLTKGTTTIVRFVMKDTGNVYEVSSISLDKRRLTNTTIAKVYRAFWLPNGEGFVSQKADPGGLIESSFVKLKPTVASTSNELALPYEPVISNLPSGIKEISVSPDSRKIFYYVSLGQNGGMRSFTSDPQGTNSATLYESQVGEWAPVWYSQNFILLSTKPSSNSQSLGLVLNTVTKTASKLFSGVVGVTALPKSDGKYTLLSLGGDAPQLSLLNISKNERVSVSLQTIADKCAWKPQIEPILLCGVPKNIPKAKYPDAWYQGLINTTDTIQLIDPVNNTNRGIVDPSAEAGEDVDVELMLVSKNGDYAVFINKRDQSLWLLSLNS